MNAASRELVASLLESGSPPELWDAETGTIRDAHRQARCGFQVAGERRRGLAGAPTAPRSGEVRDLVRVTVNGRELGVWWHGPFVRDITEVLRPGEFTLGLAVTNTWHNHPVGEEQEPADFEFGTDRGVEMGRALTGSPEWFLKNKPRPTKRRMGFVTWF